MRLERLAFPICVGLAFGPLALAFGLGAYTCVARAAADRPTRASRTEVRVQRGRSSDRRVVVEAGPASAPAPLALAGVTGVEFAAGGTLAVALGATDELRIEGSASAARRVVTEVRRDTLVIRNEPGARASRAGRLHFVLTLREIRAISGSGDGDITVGDLKAGPLALTLNGSGDLQAGAIDADRVVVRVNGSGGLRLSGVAARTLEVQGNGSGDIAIGGRRAPANRDVVAERLGITLNGAGSLETGAVRATEAAVRLNGSGNARLHALTGKRFDVALQSSGDLVVDGGEVEEQVVALRSSGDYDGRRLCGARAQVTLQGSASAALCVRDALQAAINGSGNVRYLGNATVVRTGGGSGEVRRD